MVERNKTGIFSSFLASSLIKEDPNMDFRRSIAAFARQIEATFNIIEFY